MLLIQHANTGKHLQSHSRHKHGVGLDYYLPYLINLIQNEHCKPTVPSLGLGPCKDKQKMCEGRITNSPI